MSRKNLLQVSFILVLSFAYVSYGSTFPPEPDPMMWRYFPAAWDEGAIVMTATEANDVNNPPVMYFFECTTDITKNSIWQAGTQYTVAGLDPNTWYSFRVKAKDALNNETAWSSVKSAKTYPASEPNVLKLDFNNNAAGDNTDETTEEAFLAYVLGDNGMEVNGVVIDVTGDLMSRQRCCPYYVPIDSNHEQLYKDFICGMDHTADMTVTLWGLGVDRDCNITIYAFDHSSTPNRVADWYCNGTYLLTTDFNGGAGNWPRCPDCYPLPVYFGEYDFNAVGHTDELGRLVLESTPGTGTAENEIYVFVNAIEIIPKGTFTPTGFAHRPVPFDGAPYPGTGEVPIDASLSWLPGTPVDKHLLYLDTDESDVENATKASHPGLKLYKELDSANHNPFGAAGFLELDTTYYWRVDENSPSDVCEGEVWSFTTMPYYNFEDYESYTDQSNLRLYWKDYHENGSGAEVFLHLASANPTWVRSGSQSMGYFVFNDYSPYYSEAYVDIATLGVDANWLDMGVKSIVLYFAGEATNPISEQPYLKLVDGDGNSAIVPYIGDLNGVREPFWHEWIIGLGEFEVNNPLINLNDVNRFIIGFDGPDPGQFAEVYFDDIMLRSTWCALSKRSADFARVDYAPGGLLPGDCIVDYKELELMAEYWLVRDNVIPPPPPPPEANLVAYWPMDEGTGDRTYTDPCDPNYTGIIRGGGIFLPDPEWAAPGAKGSPYCLYFNGHDGMRVSCPNTGFGFIEDENAITVSCWVKWMGPHVPDKGKSQGLVSRRHGWDEEEMQFTLELDSQPFYDGGIGWRYYTGGLYTESHIMDPYIGQWAHIAATYDGITARIHLNGQQKAVGPWRFSGLNPPYEPNLVFGNSYDEVSWADSPETLNGYIDEIHIYNCALSDGEIQYLACEGPVEYGYIIIPPKLPPPDLYTEASYVGEANYTAVVDGNGLVTGTSTGWSDSNGPWYEYPSGWWNAWFDNNPHNENRYKVILVDLTLTATDTDANATILVGGSTGEWAVTANGSTRPPLPEDGIESLYINRSIDGGMIYNGPVTGNVEIWAPVIIYDYNPRWVFIDIQGNDFEITNGYIRHECRAIGIINFKDFAVLANYWLVEEMFP